MKPSVAPVRRGSLSIRSRDPANVRYPWSARKGRSCPRRDSALSPCSTWCGLLRDLRQTPDRRFETDPPASVATRSCSAASPRARAIPRRRSATAGPTASTSAAATGKYLVKFATEPLPDGDLLVERAQDDRPAGQAKLFTYFIARKVADGAYLIGPLNENDLAATDRDGICGKDQPEGFCAISKPRPAHDLGARDRGQDLAQHFGRRPHVRGRAEGRKRSGRRSF